MKASLSGRNFQAVNRTAVGRNPIDGLIVLVGEEPLADERRRIANRPADGHPLDRPWTAGPVGRDAKYLEHGFGLLAGLHTIVVRAGARHRDEAARPCAPGETEPGAAIDRVALPPNVADAIERIGVVYLKQKPGFSRTGD